MKVLWTKKQVESEKQKAFKEGLKSARLDEILVSRLMPILAEGSIIDGFFHMPDQDQRKDAAEFI